jgi:hypothetical protein
MVNIEVDFDVFKTLTSKRESEAHTYNDVLRSMLGLPKQTQEALQQSGTAWVAEGVTFPSGTELQARFKGKLYKGKVNEEGTIIVDGKPFPGASPAAKHITGTSTNGWKFWECRRPGETSFTLIDRLRKKGK